MERAEMNKEKEQHLQKLEKILDGTNQKLSIRKVELDKEWERLDQLRHQLEQRELQLQKDKEQFDKEK